MATGDLLERLAAAAWRFLNDPATRQLAAIGAVLAPVVLALAVFACSRGHV